MFVDIGLGIRIFCDYAAKAIVVQKNVSPFPGGSLWSEVSRINSPSDWYISEFSAMIKKEELQNDIDWFWIDLSAEQASNELPD